MKRLVFIIATVACFQAMAKEKLKKESLSTAFSAALEQSQQDHSASRVKLEVEEQGRYAAWHGSERSVIIAASQQVDPTGMHALPEPKAVKESQVDPEEIIKSDLQDL